MMMTAKAAQALGIAGAHTLPLDCVRLHCVCWAHRLSRLAE